MKRCQMCGSAMRMDAELTEGDRHYTWFKCLNFNCGAIFLVQRSLSKKPVMQTPQSASTAAG